MAAEDTLRVLAFTQGKNVPSARFRVRQYQAALAPLRIALQESPARFGSYPSTRGWRRLPWFAATVAERSWAAWHAAADLVLCQREMVSTLDWPERCIRRPVVLDVDDAIWLTQRRGAVDALARRARLVLCGNAWLAEHFAPLAEVVILPTAVDTELWCPRPQREAATLLWSGSASGLGYLHAIEPALRQVFAALPAARLRVVCNQRPSLPSLPAARVDFIPWSAATEVAAVQSASVGLMPLADTDWTRGKCSFKLLTYLACGVPGVASPWGMNAEVIAGGGALAADTPAQWVDALLALLRDEALRQRLGEAGRAQVEARYAVNVLAPRLAAALRHAAA